MTSSSKHILVTGATGFIGAHIVDELLRRGHTVRAASRSLSKGHALQAARPQYTHDLDIIQIPDFSHGPSLLDAAKDTDGIVHVASPFSYSVSSNERELVLPAIAGVRAVMQAAAATPSVRRVVITSSFAAVLDVSRRAPPRFAYTAADWNPLSYSEAVAPSTSPVVAYRGSKKFAELEAWRFVEKRKPHFDVVTLCPPMTFGPVCHPVAELAALNESNAMLWKAASGEELPVARVPFWVDVRDLAVAHVEALLRPEVGGKRYTVASQQKFSYGMVVEIVKEQFGWHKNTVDKGDRQEVDDSYDLDGETARKELGVEYRSFEDMVRDFVSQARRMEEQEKGVR